MVQGPGLLRQESAGSVGSLASQHGSSSSLNNSGDERDKVASKYFLHTLQIFLPTKTPGR